MKRLTIHLKNIEKTIIKGKLRIINTVSFIVKNDAEIAHHLSMYDMKIESYYLSNINAKGKYNLGVNKR